MRLMTEEEEYELFEYVMSKGIELGDRFCKKINQQLIGKVISIENLGSYADYINEVEVDAEILEEYLEG